MSDAAAFFASKKKKKFKKFNANLVDANTLARTVHVDAPALSSEPNTETTPVDVETPVEDNTRATSAGVGALKLRSEAAPDISKKVQREETKAQLAAAREGMERQAQQQKTKVAPAPAPVSRWVSARRKQETQFDVANTELFPDLSAAADKMSLSTAQKPTPKKAPRPKKAKPAMPPMKKMAELKGEESKPKPAPAAAPAPSPAAAESKVVTTVKKKKKKDLSGFKKSS